MKLQDQIDELDAVRRLRGNADYQAIFQTMLAMQVDQAHRAILNPEVSGERLEFARARYVAARDLANYLRDKEAALSAAIAKKQAEFQAGAAERIDTQRGGAM